MVVIPQQQRQQTLDTVANPELPNQVPALDAKARAVQSVGGALSGLGQHIEARDKQKASFDAQIAHDAYKVQLQQDAIEFERNAPADGTGLHDTFMEKSFKPRTQELLSKIKDPELRRRFTALVSDVEEQQWSNVVGNREYEIGNKHSLTQLGTMRESTLKIVADDPSTFQGIVAEWERRVDEAPNLTSAQRLEHKENFKAAIPGVIAETLHTRDPEAFKFSRGFGTSDERRNFLLRRLVPVVVQAESSGNPNAISPKGARGLMQVTLGAAADVAKKFGDSAFLEMDQAQRAAYLMRPDVNMRYGTAYLSMMLERYHGDVEVALIAYNAGMGNADKWLAAGRDYAALPKRGETEPYVERILGGLGTAKFASGSDGGPALAAGSRIPITTGTQPGRQPLDMSHMNAALVDRWELVQGAFGRAVPIVSAFRDAAKNTKAKGASKSQHLHGNAIDVDVAGMSKTERLRLIETASAMGFKGIGVYRNSLHFDAREGAAVMWGPSHHADSVPAWAFSAAVKHRAGKSKAIGGKGSMASGGVARSGFVSQAYNDMPLADTQLWDARAVALDRSNDDQQKMATAALKVETESHMADDLESIRRTGRSLYAGADTDAFEQRIADALGAEKLLTHREDRFVAQNIHDRTVDLGQMTDEAMDQRLANLKPAPGADFEIRKRIYDGIETEVEAVQKARTDDPATAVLKSFPEVQQAWAAFSPKDPGSAREAIQATLNAQRAIGIPGDKLAPLPAEHAGKIASVVGDVTRSVEERISALVAAVAVTPDASQQAQIIRQMVKSGLPPSITNVVEAWKRDDPAAARRLFQAAMLDPENAPKLGTADNKLGAMVEEKMLGEGTIGQTLYGFDLGDPHSADVAAIDLELAKSAARIAMAGGMSQDAAVEQAIGDIFGKVDVLDYELPSGGFVKGLVDTGTDSGVMLSGFAKANEKMIDVLHGYIARSYAALPKDATPEMRAVFEASHSNGMNRILADGVWRNIDGGWSYYDPVNRAFVSDDEGRAITFTTDELLKLGSGKAPGEPQGRTKPPKGGYQRSDDANSPFPEGAVDPVPPPVEPQPPQGRTKPPKGGYQRSDDANSPFPEGAAAIGSGLEQQRKELFDKAGITP